MKYMKDSLVGQRFGRLLVQERAGVRHSGARWRCLCDCGETTETYGFALKNGTTTSCGCRAKECLELRITHGDSGSAEHRVWEAMQERCYNPAHTNYKNYGAKGIRVHMRWLGPQGYANFLEDMGRRPSSQHSIERKEGALGYFKENCVWATRIEQNNNTSRNQWLLHEGRRQTVAQWGREKGLLVSTIRKRLLLGWSTERVLTEQPNQRYVHT